MQLIDARDETRLDAIRKLYFQAFPAAERKPFSLILKKRDEGRAEILSLEESGSFSGLAVTVFSGDLALLDYFAISPALRGQGAGGKALGMLRERYAGKAVLSRNRRPLRPQRQPRTAAKAAGVLPARRHDPAALPRQPLRGADGTPLLRRAADVRRIRGSVRGRVRQQKSWHTFPLRPPADPPRARRGRKAAPSLFIPILSVYAITVIHRNVDKKGLSTGIFPTLWITFPRFTQTMRIYSGNRLYLG